MEMFSKSKDIFFSNFNKICRTCIKTISEPLHQIFDSEVVILNESIRTCELLIAVSTLKMHPNDDLPKAICIQCLDSLTKAYNFQKMCILSDLCMRSAIIPNELQMSIQKDQITSPLQSSKKSDIISTVFEPCAQNLIAQSKNPNSIKILYSEPMNTGNENIGHSEKSIVSKSILQNDILSSEDINGIKILLLPADSELVHHSGSNIIIPGEINSSINIFPSVPPSIGNADHFGANMVKPSEINSSMNIFPTEPPSIDNGVPSDQVILLEEHMQSNKLLNEPQVDFTNVSLPEVPPWKRGTKFQSIESTIETQVENKKNNIFPTKALLTSHKDHLNVVSEAYMQSTNFPLEEKNCKEMMSMALSAVSDPVQNSNAANVPKEDEKSSIIGKEYKRCSNSLLADALSSEVEIGNSEEANVLKTKPTSEYYHNDDNEKSNCYDDMLADSHSAECDINKCDEANEIQSKEMSSWSDSDHKSNTLVDVNELIQRNVIENKTTKKEKTTNNTLTDSEESNNESMDQNSIEEDVNIDMENPEPVFQEIEKPNPRTKNNAYYTCETCGKTFDREHRLHRHMNNHKKEGRPFECEYCRRRFAQEPHLQRHLITHEKLFLDMKEVKPNVDGYQCHECPRKFLKKESLASHMKTHRNEMNASKRFKCEICSKVFESLYALTRHKQLHEGNRKYNCEICGKKFGLSSHLVDHLNMHSGIKPYVCDYCQKSFQQACTLKDHLRTHTGEQPFLCAQCGKTFNNASNLRQHQLRHSGIKRYQCPECPSKFTCKSGLFSHSTTHRNQKPYSCGTCGSRFTKNYSLKKHERIHTGEKPYKCDYCEMRFNSSDHMKRHMRTHTGEKPYKCKYCERKFAQSNDMIKHLRSHVGENVYKCEECDASFRLNTELKRHISEHYQAQIKDKTKKNISQKE